MEGSAADGIGRADPDGKQLRELLVQFKNLWQPVATPFFFYMLSGTHADRRHPGDHAEECRALGAGADHTLLAQAAIYLMLYAPFVAGVQIILYAGGIMVLFLFVIMLVSIERSMKERQFNSQWVIGIIAAAALGGLFIACLHQRDKAVP